MHGFLTTWLAKEDYVQPLIIFSQAIMDLVFKKHCIWKGITNQIPWNKSCLVFHWVTITTYDCRLQTTVSQQIKLMIAGPAWSELRCTVTPCKAIKPTVNRSHSIKVMEAILTCIKYRIQKMKILCMFKKYQISV